MPLATVRVRLNRTAAGADPVYWSWAVDEATYDESSGLALVNATLSGLETAVTATGSAQFADMDADLIECFPGAGGPAYYVQGLAPGLIIGTSVSSPHVIQCAVNELGNSPRGPKVLGRMFVGPLASTAVQGNGTLSTGAIQAAIDVMQEVAAAHVAAGFVPVVISRYVGGVKRATPVGTLVTGLRVDSRLDILVSRRLPADDTTVDYPIVPAP